MQDKEVGLNILFMTEHEERNGQRGKAMFSPFRNKEIEDTNKILPIGSYCK